MFGSVAFRPKAGGKAFPSGTRLLFQQTAAPLGWTKVTTFNDVGLRVVSGTTSSVTNQTAFSTVFGQSATGAHTLSTGELASHTHTIQIETGGGGVTQAPLGDNSAGSFAFPNSGSAGGGGSHTHPISLQLNYVDVIIASKS